MLTRHVLPTFGTTPLDEIKRSDIRNLILKNGVPAYLIDEAEQIDRDWLNGKATVGLTAGASAPEDIVQGVVEQLCAWGADTVDESMGRKEPVTFSLPIQCRVEHPSLAENNHAPHLGYARSLEYAVQSAV